MKGYSLAVDNIESMMLELFHRKDPADKKDSHVTNIYIIRIWISLLELKAMCKVCGCTPCKCGRDIVNAVCAGCKKPYDDCTCSKI